MAVNRTDDAVLVINLNREQYLKLRNYCHILNVSKKNFVLSAITDLFSTLEKHHNYEEIKKSISEKEAK